MPHYYAVCREEDQELTEQTLINYFADGDMLVHGPYSGAVLYNNTAIGFFVKNENTFNQITDRLLPEAIWFLDEKGEMMEFD